MDKTIAKPDFLMESILRNSTYGAYGGGTEHGKCDICGENDFLSRTYFHYDIHCQCCGCKEDGRDMHFELVRHCGKCVPAIPETIRPMLRSKIDGVEYRLPISGMVPYSVSGAYDESQELHPGKCKTNDVQPKTMNYDRQGKGTSD